MENIKRPAVCFALALILGEILYLINNGGVFVLILTIMTIMVFFLGKGMKICLRALLAGLCIFLCIYGNWAYGREVHCQKVINGMAEEAVFVNVQGNVKKVEDKRNSVYCYLENCSIQKCVIKKGKIYAKGKGITGVRLFVTLNKDKGFYRKKTRFIPGNEVGLLGCLEEFRTPGNDGEFNEKEYYASMGIYGKIKDPDEKYIEVYGSNVLRRKIWDIKCFAGDRISRICHKKYREIYKGILIGEKSKIEKETMDYYRLSGIAHLLTISGLHISLIGMGCYKILRRFLGINISAVSAVFLAMGYGVLTGEGSSVKRGVIMLCINFMGLILKRTYDMLSAMSVAVILLLLETPFAIFNFGVLVSFAAILGICVVVNITLKFLDTKKKWLKALLTTVGITMMTGPLLIFNDYLWNPYTVILNLIVVPMMTVVVVSGIFGLLVGSFSINLGTVIISVGEIVLGFYEKICKLVLKMPNSIVVVGNISIKRLILYYFVLSMGLFLIWKFGEHIKQFRGIIKIGFWGRVLKSEIIVYVLFLTAPISVIAGTEHDKPWIKMLDVGQGECIYLTDGKTRILSDCGSSSEKDIFTYKILPFLKYNGVKKLDYVIISHTDADHISALKELLEYKVNGENYVKCLVLPGIDRSYREDIDEEIIKLAKTEKIRVLFAERGMNIKASKNMELKFLWPEGNSLSPENNVMDKNDLCTVFRAKIYDKKILFTGDIGEKTEKILLEEGRVEECDVLKIPHHGSKNSANIEFFEKVHGKAGIISCGIDNSYGHPHSETLEILKKVKTKVRITADSGQISIKLS